MLVVAKNDLPPPLDHWLGNKYQSIYLETAKDRSMKSDFRRVSTLRHVDCQLLVLRPLHSFGMVINTYCAWQTSTNQLPVESNGNSFPCNTIHPLAKLSCVMIHVGDTEQGL